MRFNTTADGRLETVETIHDAEARERQLRAAIARDRGTLRRMLDGNEPFHCDASPGLPLAVAAGVIASAAATWKTGAPDCAGVWECRVISGTIDYTRNAHERYFDGENWHLIGRSNEVLKDKVWLGAVGVRVEYRRLVAPDAETVDYRWLTGKQAKAANRDGALWHMKNGDGSCCVASMHDEAAWSGLALNCAFEVYRRAAPGAKLGDPYREEAYAGVAG